MLTTLYIPETEALTFVPIYCVQKLIGLYAGNIESENPFYL